MRRICKTCRYWQRNKLDKEKTCNCVDSDMRFDETAEDYSCNHWEMALEQDGNATWFME